jgi:transposase
MEPLYTMTAAELTRLEAVHALEAGASTAEIAARLHLSVRQVKRLKRRYLQGGPAALGSQRRGKPSNNRVDPGLIDRAIARVRERYGDFGPTLASEKLLADGIAIKRERLRQAMIAAGIWEPARKKPRKLHPPRERRPQRGELVQGDGSPHAWFEKRGPRCSLLLLIDDATSFIGAGHFAPHESTEAYFELLGQYIKALGKPHALYVDKLSVFRANRVTHGRKTEDATQFARAMRELDIELICANSPQAKGRVERANRTLQDRLVKELRLHDISDIASANAFLPAFLGEHNARFAVLPRCELDAHRPTPDARALELILSHTEERAVSKDLTIKFKSKLYQLDARDIQRRLQYQRVLVRELAGTMLVEYGGKPIAYTEIPTRRDTPVVDAKTINSQVDRTRLGPRIPDPKKQRTVARSHPWKATVRRAPAAP